MSEEGQKTDQLSERRQREAIETGRIPISRETVMFLSLAASLFTFSFILPKLTTYLVAMLRDTLAGIARPNEKSGSQTFLMTKAALVGASAMLAAALAALAGTFVQTRARFWPHLVLPDMSRLGNSKILQMGTRAFWSETALATVKIMALGFVAYLIARNEILTLARLTTLDTAMQLALLAQLLWKITTRTLLVTLVFVGTDFALSHLRFRTQMKMTREEAKREMKEDEGDALMKSRRRRRAREIAKNRAAIEVPRADVLVVNPTHIAIAIRYRKDEGSAPRVTAKGKGVLAEYMRELAHSNGIMIVEDITLARLLHRRVKVGARIPAETYQAVAAILAFVYRATRRTNSTSGTQAHL